jgi:hypothetical protein
VKKLLSTAIATKVELLDLLFFAAVSAMGAILWYYPRVPHAAFWIYVSFLVAMIGLFAGGRRR